MSMSMKKTALAVAMAVAAMGASAVAQAENVIKFDRDGAGPSGSILTDALNWNPGNLLMNGVFPLPSAFSMLGQSSLSGFGLAGVGPLAGTEFTYQFSAPSVAVFIAAGGGLDTQLNISAGGGVFNIYYDNFSLANGALTGGVASSSITGAGFGDGTLIMSGAFQPSTGTFTLPNPTPGGVLPPLDGFGANDQAPITSVGVTGSITYNIDVTFRNPAFFLTDVTLMVFPIADMNHTTTTAAPFTQTNPSDFVVGVAPTYGTDGVNDINCGLSPKCDLHVQGNAASSFFHEQSLPEPTSLALFGLGLGALGMGVRRRRRA